VPEPQKSRLRAYLRSPSTRLAATIGVLMYVSYAAGFVAWSNPVLMAVTALIGIALPSYSRLSNRIEQRVNYALVLVTAGRAARFTAQFAFNLAAFLIIQLGGVFGDSNLEALGGIVGAAALTTAASQGAQYVAIMMFNRNIGDANRNVLVALSLNIVVTAAAVASIPFVQPAFVVLGIGFAIFVFGGGILSDLRGLFFPKRGVGIFLGTFNPIHLTHLRLVRDALENRNLERIIIHPTLVPKGHRLALERGDIVVDRIESGMQIYERTDRADPYVDYFPTGQKFFAPETRRFLIEGALDEASLSHQVEVAFMPEIYDAKGFHGVIAEIKRKYPGKPIHGIHGSDLGGMMVRAIMDECGWIYPIPIKRRDGISATAVRAGAIDMTPETISTALSQLQSGSQQIVINERKFRNDNGILVRA
jgi:hypothetical protein